MLTGSRNLANGSPPSLEKAHSCRLAAATWLIKAEKKVRMIGVTMMTVAALLLVELKKSRTNGVEFGFANRSASPAQNIKVTVAMNAKAALNENDVRRE